MRIRLLLAIASVCSVAFAACGGNKNEDTTVTPETDGGTGDDDVAVDDTDDTDDDTTPPPATRCRRNSDCDRGSICRDGTCGVECREDRDCCTDGTATCGRVCTDDGCVAGDIEACNGFDDDRDGQTDEGFDLTSDLRNCGRCGVVCATALAHVDADGVSCDEGVCRLEDGGCADGFFDINGTDADGCEYGCIVSNRGVEEPDGDDNNCDGAKDEGFACARGTSRSCGAGTGVCSEGTQTCLTDGTWSACTGDVVARVEVCNGLDDDCDNTADEGFDLATDVANCGVCGNDCLQVMPHGDASCVDGECVFGECQTYHVDRNEDPSDGCEYRCPVIPVLAAEICDTQLLDENCDGRANEGCACINGTAQPCGLASALHGVGICRLGAQQCVTGAWTACVGQRVPFTEEACDRRDDDCDGTVPTDEMDLDVDGYTPCEGDCDDDDRNVNPAMPELCNGLDDDCNGRVDEEPFFVGAACRGLGSCATAVGAYECADLLTTQCSVDFGGSTFAGAVEAANGLDDDCNGSVDEGFVCIAGAARTCGLTDPTRDGVGVCRLGLQSCASDGTWGLCANAVAPSPESCNGLDDDCDGAVPASEADADGDAIRICAGDCNDTLAAVRPTATESCNGTDDDCDGDTDEDYFVGATCDGIGACGVGILECASTTTTRCSTNPGGSADASQSETCNRTDDDCDGTVDADVAAVVVANDAANCGACGVSCAVPNTLTACAAGMCVATGCATGFQLVSGACLRCDVWPTTAESCDTGFLDDDCDGVRNEGCVCADGATQPCGLDPALNGVGVCRVGTQTCASGAWGACAGAKTPSSETCNGLDDDCDGIVPTSETDADRDSYRVCAGDCSDVARDVNPDASESCNGVDDDCDGATDEDYFVGAPCDGEGACGIGVVECANTTATRCSTNPGGSAYGSPSEACDNRLDDDCDGSVDEDCGACTPGQARSCGTSNVGVCRFGTQTCQADRTWGGCVGAVEPSSEACNMLDDDCDGTVPTSELDSDRDGYTACADDCDDASDDVRPGASESCNGVDDDCDGSTDEDYFVGVPCDGEGACGAGTYECDGLDGFRCSTNPGGSDDGSTTESCDRSDEDCDGVVDDVAASVVASDVLNCGACGIACSVPNAISACVGGACTVTGCVTGFLLVNGSCLRCDVWPIAAESCDAGFLDEDCDGQRNEACACINGTTMPCDLDLTLDGIGVCRVGLQTCTSGSWSACIGAVTPSSEVCNGLDDDCDGVVPLNEGDADDDRFSPCAGDCDDTSSKVNPAANAAVCDGVDNNCNGSIDEGFSLGFPCPLFGSIAPACAGGVLECNPSDPSGLPRCSTSPGGSEYPDPPPVEICDNLMDDDCDGSVDEGCGECSPGVQRPCGIDPALHNVGICRAGVQTCAAGRTWGVCDGATPPLSAELCNGLDDDCDGEMDEGFDFMSDPAYCGSCFGDCKILSNVATALTCVSGVCDDLVCRPGFSDLNALSVDGCEYGCFVSHNGVERCDGLDNDCDGVTDEPPTCAPPPPNAPMTFSVTLPAGFEDDATSQFCATFVNGLWSCGGYPLTETVDVGTGARTYATSGAAIAGNHEFGLCTSRCDTANGVWVVTEDANGLLVEAATPTVTYDGASVATNLGRNGQQGGNWVGQFP